MKLSIYEIGNRTEVQLDGNEPWLVKIENELQRSTTRAPSRITGHLTLTKDEAGFIYGKGHMSHRPILSCYRCDLDVPWVLEEEISVTWRPPYEQNPDEDSDLSVSDLDVYFIEDKTIDPAQVIHDCLQCALPEVVVKKDPDSETCLVCKLDLAQPHVYQSGHPSTSESSPFSVLKNLLTK